MRYNYHFGLGFTLYDHHILLVLFMNNSVLLELSLQHVACAFCKFRERKGNWTEYFNQ